MSDKNPIKVENFIIPGCFGDGSVHLCRCAPENPNGIQVVLLHGVHSSAAFTPKNKFRLLAKILAKNGFTAWLVETSRIIRNRQDFDDADKWAEAAFHGKTFADEQRDVFAAVEHVLRAEPGHPLWLWGFSLGGIIALSAASVKFDNAPRSSPAVERLILSGTGFEAYPEVEAVMMSMPVLSTLRSTLSPDMSRKVSADAIISFRGSFDEVFSEKSCLDLLKNLSIPENKKIFRAVEGADHSMRMRNGKPDPEVMEEMVNFIVKTWLT